MAQQEIAAHEGAATFHALEGPLLRVCLMRGISNLVLESPRIALATTPPRIKTTGIEGATTYVTVRGGCDARCD
jgi:hypothetical protein